MLQPNKTVNRFGLSPQEHHRLTSWMAHIAIQLSPGTQVRRGENETRIGASGSLCIYNDGHWYSYEADEGGDVYELIQFFNPHFSALQVRQFALTWLHKHQGVGDIDASVALHRP